VRRPPALLGALLALALLAPAAPVGPEPRGGRGRPAAAPAPVWGYRVVNEYPHDPGAFTQGLAYAAGALYEGTGRKGKSTLRRVELATGRVRRARALAPRHFGEGVAVVGDRVYQLTWRTRTCFVYDRRTFARRGAFRYPGEGWGLAAGGGRLVMSDGTARLSFRDPGTFAEVGAVEVRDGGGPVPYLNELEWVGGEVWANVWPTDRIARIDPATGRVLGWVDLAGLLPPEERQRRRVGVLNGIAHDPATGRLFVTGKRWPTLFEVAPVPPAATPCP
jgi:glutaminyl-peptide cyclotransferase